MGRQKQESAKSTIWDRIVVSLVIAAFSLLLLFFVFQTAKSINLIVRGEVGHAYCSKVKVSTMSSGGGRSKSYQYFVELSLPDGTVHESKVISYSSLYEGKAVEVLYDPVFPSLMELNNPFSLGIYPVMFGFVIGGFVWVNGNYFKRTMRKFVSRKR